MNQNPPDNATEPRSVDQRQACSESDDWRDFAAHFERREGFAPNCRDYQVITLLWYWRQSRQRLKVATERYMSAAASYHVSPWDADAIRKYAAAKNALKDVLGIPNIKDEGPPSQNSTEAQDSTL